MDAWGEGAPVGMGKHRCAAAIVARGPSAGSREHGGVGELVGGQAPLGHELQHLRGRGGPAVLFRGQGGMNLLGIKNSGV